mgnify:CR=1 FL=1
MLELLRCRNFRKTYVVSLLIKRFCSSFFRFNVRGLAFWFLLLVMSFISSANLDI